MSMRPRGPGEIPAETIRVARAAFEKGSLAIRVRDELGSLSDVQEFRTAWWRRGAGRHPGGRGEGAGHDGGQAMTDSTHVVSAARDRVLAGDGRRDSARTPAR